MLVAVYEDTLMLDPKSTARGAKSARDRQRRNDIERRSRRRRRARVEGLKAEVAMLEAVVTSLQLLDQATRATGDNDDAKEDEARAATLEPSSARAYLCQETKRLLAERWQLQETFARHEGSVRAIQVILDDVERSTLDEMPSEQATESASPVSDILFEDLDLESEASWGDFLE
ncbi:hypothetical protein PINS_up021793 [Pythium insidiosum]|nr:hypothetical protein PINS_up012311 [Pythium insidiosum]GLE09865.1 hypothetical protein PINS_up021793 [Pythium insidiosum]